jgi:uncharacterized membrane protein (DUF2068 family)
MFQPANGDKREPDASRARLTGLRVVAVLESIKGLFVLAAACGILTLLHRDAAHQVEHLLAFLHLNPEGHLVNIIVRLASKVTDAKLWAAAAAAVLYSAVRFVEAYGLWNRRVWAEWVTLLSGSTYLPWEAYETIVHPTALHFILFGSNLGIVLYMLYVRIRAMH